MRETTIARNYAETLLELAQRGGDLRGWGETIDTIANAMESDRRLRVFLESPRVSAQQKNEIFQKAYAGALPRTFVRFLQALVSHRRQMLIPAIAREYHDLVDQVEGRVHATVSVARPVDDRDRQLVTSQLSRVLGKEVVPHFHVNPSILGGVIVRVGDTVLDGSVKRRMATLRARMVGGAAR
ncbi:MAG TPA: F0F1 ATP synthase subunit delta [Gemmatimonadaceae bacterium]|jgi:F-type H+-transporting ATPase subunit delta|nr:F0F1 ATP synthase subunit delta [Gemmatimonadaceae bacterium]